MNNVKIKNRALESALQGAKEVWPNEFIGLLEGKEKDSELILGELIIAPFSHYGNGESSFSDFFIPTNNRAKASFHSHPNPPALPSRQDLNFFSRMQYNFISCPPFTKESTNCFDREGKKIAFKIV